MKQSSYFQLLKRNIDRFVQMESGVNVIFVRHGQSISNQSGSLCGWTDTALTIEGRKQAHSLLPFLHPHQSKFDQIYSSDLQRSADTAKISLGFPTSSQLIQYKKSLRELNFGDDENKHFDSLTLEQKDVINNFDYSAPNGESWYDVQQRVQQFFYQELSDGNYLVYTHGGVICSLTYELGFQDLLPNCSVIGLQLDRQDHKKQMKGANVIFTWVYDQSLIDSEDYTMVEPGLTEL